MCETVNLWRSWQETSRWHLFKRFFDGWSPPRKQNYILDIYIPVKLNLLINDLQGQIFLHKIWMVAGKERGKGKCGVEWIYLAWPPPPLPIHSPSFIDNNSFIICDLLMTIFSRAVILWGRGEPLCLPVAANVIVTYYLQSNAVFRFGTKHLHLCQMTVTI